MARINPNRLIPVIMLLSVVLMTSCMYRGYKNNGKKVTFHSYDPTFLIPDSKDINADPATFEALSDIYGRDKNHVYYWGEILDSVDASSFRIIDEDYTADKNHIYFNTFKIEKADPETFRIINKDLAEDKNDYFWQNGALNVVDKKSFVLVPNNDNSDEYYWGKDKYRAYNLPWHVSVSLSDYDSFRPLSVRYAIDNHQVYFRGTVVNGADPNTFEEVAWDIGQDKNGVYYRNKHTSIKEARKLEYRDRFYIEDGNIYSKHLDRIINADTTTFKCIKPPYAGCSENYWYADKNHVWLDTILIKELNPSKIRFISKRRHPKGGYIDSWLTDDSYITDETNVFFRDSLIIGADPKTFEIIEFDNDGNSIVFDKNHIYSGKPNSKHYQYINKKFQSGR